VSTIDDLKDRGGRASGYARDLRSDIYWAVAYKQDVPLGCGEFLFPYAAVVPVDQAEIPRALGPSLVVTAITRDRALIARLLSSPNVGRLNLGGIPTCKISWDQPHEGNLFDHLYARRAFQYAV